MSDATPVYAGPNCPACGGDVLPAEEVKHRALWETRTEHGCFEYACLSCRKGWESDTCYSEDAIGFEFNDPDYDIETCLDSDLIVTRSPFYTHAQFCSPCVPGAGSLDSPFEGGVRTYCLSHDWFEGNVAPYPVFRVADDSPVVAELEAVAL